MDAYEAITLCSVMLRFQRASAALRAICVRLPGESFALRQLRRILTDYFRYYHQARTHLALAKDAPDVRLVECASVGKIVQLPEVGGLHHRYHRQAA